MWTCKHCKQDFEFSNLSDKANHSRWCNDNPKRNNWNKKQSAINKYGDYKEYKVLHPNGQVEWHIGGHSRFDTHLAQQLLSEELQQAHDELMRDLS